MNILPGPWRITFDTNPDICNIHCIMCEEHSNYRDRKTKHKRIMDFEIIENVINSASGYGLQEIIPSTMGEPLLYPKMEDIIELVQIQNLKINLTTNGTFPRLGVKKWGDLILPIASDIKISINGAKKTINEQIMNGIEFEKQLANVAKLIETRDNIIAEGINNPTITFQITYMERNLMELPGLLELALKMGVNRFKGHHLWITWPELKVESLTRNEKSRKKWNKTVEEMQKLANKMKLKNGKRIRLDNVYKIPINQKSGILSDNWVCPFLGKEAWIAWDGTFNVCCSPDNVRKTFGNYGNVNEMDFMSLWNSEKYSSLVSNWGQYDVCRKCNMRRPEENIRGSY